KKTYIPFDGSVPLNNKLNNLYEKDPSLISIDYLKIGNDLKMLDKTNRKKDNFFRFTTCIYTDEPITHPLTLSLAQTLPNNKRKRLGTVALYLNQERQKIQNDEATLEFKKGYNQISILYHWGDLDERKDIRSDYLPTETYLGKLNFLKQKKVRAELKPMTLIETH